MKIWKKPKKSITPFCQTIRVVISPNGLNAPPALAATTMLIHASATNFLCPTPTAITTAHISNAVVKLSAIGEMKKDRTPVIQKTFRKLKLRATSQARRYSNTFRSVIVLMKVIATKRNIKSSANSRNTCLKAPCVTWVSYPL